MRRRIATLIAGVLLLVASSAWSYSVTVNGVSSDVGGLDEVKYSTLLGNSGDQTEIDWINKQLGTSYTLADYTKNESPSWTQVTGQPFYYAFDLSGTPDYYLVKTGNTESALDTYLVKNNASLDWAVLNLYDIDAVKTVGNKKTTTVTEPDKVSHLGEPVAPVPEPGTMMLLGAGFLGLAVYGKRRRNA